ncbi:MAG: DUF4290 domain-containing protein [Flavobacteriales bacterium]|nr:DUF4290 domain-containing protein [Flavobacteriales bacterium]MCB9447057.1 DUF4290 domain-containing protein [Flavobacteriales bacterium]
MDQKEARQPASVPELEYNTERGLMIIPEYGRNIQKMVNYACTVEDKTQRNKVAQSIITVMGQLNPHLRDINDFKHKLWDHLFIISNFNLDVDSPYEKPSPDILESKPEQMRYPQHHMRFRHYGFTIEEMIRKATEMEEGEKKDALVTIVANMMKKAYLSWNKDSVNDQDILDHLDMLSHGKLKMKDPSRLTSTNEILAQVGAQNNNSGGGHKKGKKKPMQKGNRPRKRH